MKNYSLVAVVTALVLLMSSASLAGVRYTIAELPPPPGASYVEANSINDRRQVVGVAYYPRGVLRPVIWEDGVPMLIPGVPPKQSGHAQSINNRGNVALNWWDDFHSYRVAISYRGLDVTLRPLGPPSDVGVLSLNDNDHAVGYSSDSSGKTHAVLWRSHAVVSLGIKGEMGTMARDIDNADRIVGVRVSGQVGHAFRWHRGRLSWLQPLRNGFHAAALAINNHGQVVGHATDGSGQTRAVIWAGETPVELGSLPQHASSVATDINDDGFVVGTSYTPEDHAAVLWYDGNTFDLNQLIPSQSEWYLSHADATNALGQVTGRGTVDGREAIYLLTPVPEPAWLALVVCMLGLVRRRRA